MLTTKEKPVGRVDDPFLIDKIRNEKEGILLWALEGLHRLIRNNYRFTISERTAANLKEAMEQGNNILGFLKSEGYFEIRQGAKCKSTDFDTTDVLEVDRWRGTKKVTETHSRGSRTRHVSTTFVKNVYSYRCRSCQTEWAIEKKEEK